VVRARGCKQPRARGWLTGAVRSDALDVLGLSRYCCRRMLMTHVDLIEKARGLGGQSSQGAR